MQVLKRRAGLESSLTLSILPPIRLSSLIADLPSSVRGDTVEEAERRGPRCREAAKQGHVDPLPCDERVEVRGCESRSDELRNHQSSPGMCRVRLV